jgi:hypothetical protein
MKTECYLCIAFFLLTGLFLQRANAQANTELSNLISPTKVNQSLVPITSNSKNLGSTSASWGSVYLGFSIYLKGKRFLSYGNDSTNVFVGSYAGNKPIPIFGIKTGLRNTATGQYALYSYTSGSGNTANGSKALYSNNTGTDNTANGSYALYSNTTGSGNTANGSNALYSNTASGNTATGRSALYHNTTGNDNTANGQYALYSNTTGINNTANGEFALYSNTTGSDNTANGLNALSDNITGSENTADGYLAGWGHDNNTGCTFIGYEANAGPFNVNNSTALGRYSVVTTSNQVRIGNSFVTSIGGYEPWTNLSDARFKRNVKENVPGLTFINQLHAITYTIDVTSLRNFLGEDKDKKTTAKGKTIRKKNPEAEALIQKGIQEKEKIIRTGFAAQEVEEAAKRIGYDFSGVDKPANEHTPYGLRYSDFVVPLVKAVQELSKQNEDLQKQIDELKAIVLKSNQQSTLNVSSAALGQNIPNPFSNSTTIHYTLPEKSLSAKIIITGKNGKILKEVNVSGAGNGTLNVNATTLSSGAYQYSLYIDGRLIDTKQMVLTK